MAKNISRRHMLVSPPPRLVASRRWREAHRPAPTGNARALSTGGWIADYPAEPSVLGTNLQRRPGACETVATGAPWEGLQARRGPDGLHAAV